VKTKIIFIQVLAFLFSCSPIELVEPPDLEEQRRVDIELINDYLMENGISEYDTTESGARYFFDSLGSGEIVIQNDLIEVDYIASNLNGVITNTSFKDIADTVPSVPQNQEFGPRPMTYTRSGWTFRFVTFINELQGDALAEAISEAYENAPVGTKITVILPSDQAFGAQSTVWTDAFSVLIYEVILTGKI